MSSTARARPSVLVASHTYVVGANRAKFVHLARHAEITLLVPQRWRDTLRVMPLDPPPAAAPYQLIAAPTFFDGRLARYFFSPRALWAVLPRVRPALVHLETEPLGLSFLQFALCKKILGYRLSFFTWQNIFLRTTPIERINLALADAAIAGNREAVEVLRRKNFSNPIACVPQLGIELSVPPVREAQHPFRVGYVGRLVREKGLLVLLDALAALDGDWTLTLVGDGPLRAELHAAAAARGLQARVRFTGALPHVSVADELCALDVLVLPSLSTPTWKEQFGHVLIEAMACGVPVVGSDSGAIPSVIGEAGLVVREGNVGALRAALQRLLHEPDLRAALSVRGRERVRAHYTHEQIAAQTWSAWQAALRA